MFDTARTSEPLHRFSPDVGCEERSCIHWDHCVAAMPQRNTHPNVYFPDYELRQNSGPDQVGGTGGARSGTAEFLCYSYESRPEGTVGTSGEPEEGDKMKRNAWKVRVEAERRRKDSFFASHPDSPLPPEDRDRFEGLAYWDPDSTYRFELILHEYRDKETFQVGDTAGRERSLWRWGEFRFQLDGRSCTLHAYRDDPGREHLFVPFRDVTSGDDTYAAGRYLDLEPYAHRTEDGRWIVDFNASYNPWCAYSEEYVCPFVPPENWLECPIRAGEKKCPLKKE